MKKYPQVRPSDEVRDIGKLFARHIQEDADNFKAIREVLESMDKKLDPISETYSTVSTMGKWVIALMVFLSVVVGLIIGLKTLFNK